MKQKLLLVLFLTLGIFFTQSILAQDGNRVKVSNDYELVQAMNNPDVISVEITKDGYYESLGENVVNGTVVTLGDYDGGLRAACTLSISKTDGCFVSGTADGIVTASTSGDPSCPPTPTTAPFGWTVTNKPAGSTVTFNDPALSLEMDYTVDMPGQYTLKYSWDAFNEATTNIFFWSTPTVTVTPQAEPVCGSQVFEFTTDAGSYPGPQAMVTLWEVTDGSSNVVTPTTPTSSPWTFTPSAYPSLDQCGDYTLTVTVTNPANGSSCSSSDEAEFYIYDTPTGVDAGADQTEVCEVAGVMSTTLVADGGLWSCSGPVVDLPPSGNYEWSYVSGPDATPIFSASTSETTDVTVDTPGVYTFLFTTTNGNCSTTSSTSVTFYDLPTADAGTDQDVCEVLGDYTTTLAGTAGAASFGTTTILWTEVDGSSATITDETTETPGIEVPTYGTYVFEMAVTNGVACTVTSTVTVDFYDLATDLSAGMDQEICEGYEPVKTLVTGYYAYVEGSYVASNHGANTVAWTQFSGPGTITFADYDANGTNLTADECGEYVLDFTVTTGGPDACETVTSTTIYFYDLPANVDAGTHQDVCYDVTDGFMVSLDGTFGPDSDPTSNTLDCNNTLDPIVEWTKVSGPGTITFDDAADASTTATSDVCGTYVLAFEVTNGNDCSVSNTVTVDFYALPDNVAITADAKVCGYTTDMEGSYTQDCETNPEETTVEWTVTGAPSETATATFGWLTDESFPTVTATTCGEYEFTYTVTNITGCETTSSTTVIFYETPDITVSQGEPEGDVYTCSTVTYEVNNIACGEALWTYNWTVTGGLFDGTVTQTTGTSVSVTWDQTPGVAAGNVSCTANTIGLVDCEDTDDLDVDLIEPTLEGQVKYWNETETYMPTPFPTDFNGAYPHDYFYAELYRGLGKTPTELVDTYIVQPNLMVGSTGQDSTLMSYYGFTIPTETDGCNGAYYVKVYDGGLSYDPSAPVGSATNLGASYTYTNWGGVNATDAYAIQLMAAGANLNSSYPWVGLYSDSPSYGFYSNDIADVNTSGYTTTALDALIVNYRAVGLLASYPYSGSNLFSPNFTVAGRMVSALPEITWDDYFSGCFAKSVSCDDIIFEHSAEDYMYYDDAIDHKYTSAYLPLLPEANFMNIYYSAEGDINGSYIPTSGGFKSLSNMELVYEDLAGTSVENVMTIPIKIDRSAELNAISLFMSFRNDLIEVIETNYGEDFVSINNEEGILNIGWFSTDTKDVDANEIIAQIKVRILAEIPEGTELFKLNANTELADPTATPISDVTLKTLGVTTDKVAFSTTELTSSNYPNPFNNSTTITYTLPESGKVKVSVINSMGTVVATLVEEVQEAGVQNLVYNTDIKAGVYFYTIILQGEAKTYSVVERMIVVN